MNNLSIHPGRGINNYNPRKRRDGENITQPPKNPKKGILGKRTAKLEARRQDRDMTIQNVKRGNAALANPEGAYRRPGSMQ